MKSQFVGMAVVSVIVFIIAIILVAIEQTSPSYAESHVRVSYDGGGRQGSLANFGIAAAKFLKRK